MGVEWLANRSFSGGIFLVVGHFDLLEGVELATKFGGLDCQFCFSQPKTLGNTTGFDEFKHIKPRRGCE